MRANPAACLAALLGLAACAALPGCALKRRHQCTASASYAGRTISGRGNDLNDVNRAREFARQNLCTDYCQDQDPVIDAAVRSARGGPPKDYVERVNTVHNPPVKALYDACVATCNTATASVPIQYTCEVTGIF